MAQRSVAELYQAYKDSSAKLSSSELRWRRKYNLLLSKGYILRPRLCPHWMPSWTTSNRWLPHCEDSLMSPYPSNLIDATRLSDGSRVYLKRVMTGSQEYPIAMFFSSENLRMDPRNHCVPILEVLQDDEDESISYLVTPLLRDMDDPPFEAVNNIVDFVDQTLDGLVFMHSRGVAHRDCAHANILMDGNSLFPKGFHPLAKVTLPDDISIIAPVHSRIGHPVKYYFIDFGISVHMTSDTEPKTVVGDDGRDREVPELYWDAPYDPFKVDIFILGNVFKQYIYEKYANVEFLLPLIQLMTQQQPEARPDAEAALRYWYDVRKTVSVVSGLWRLRPRKEVAVETVIFDSVSLVRTGVYATCRLGQWLTGSAF